jgi:uncharacterized protein HemX
MIRWSGLVAIALTIVVAIAVTASWVSTRQQLDTLSHRLAVTQSVLGDTELARANAEARTRTAEAQTRDQLATAQQALNDDSNRLAMLRTTVNNLCNRVAGNPVDVSPLSGQYLVC